MGLARVVGSGLVQLGCIGYGRGFVGMYDGFGGSK